MERNPYAAPQADVNSEIPAGQGDGIDNAVAGRYDYQISDVLKEAWDLTSGFKGTVWGAVLVLGIAGGIAGALVSLAAAGIGKALGSSAGFIVNFMMQIGLNVIMYPLSLGIAMLGVRRAAKLPVTWTMAFAYFSRLGPCVVAGVLTAILGGIGFMLLLIPGIYLVFAWMMTNPLIGDRNLGGWQAMEISRKAITKQWFKFFGLYLVLGLIVMVSAIPLGIGLIWTVPWSVVTLGVVYRRVFGVASTGAMPQ
jgi:hypothetical protein